LKLRRVKSNGPLRLQLTSLMDMFTIILVFLLMSLSSDDHDFVLQQGLDLPGSSASGAFRPAVNVTVSGEQIRVEQSIVARLEGGEASTEELAAGYIENVVRALRRAREQRGGEDGGGDDIVVIQADRTLPYRTVYLVMRSCSVAGFERYRLAIERE